MCSLNRRPLIKGSVFPLVYDSTPRPRDKYKFNQSVRDVHVTSWLGNARSELNLSIYFSCARSWSNAPWFFSRNRKRVECRWCMVSSSTGRLWGTAKWISVSVEQYNLHCIGLARSLQFCNSHDATTHSTQHIKMKNVFFGFLSLLLGA